MIGIVGLIEDADKCMTQDFKKEGDLVVLLGANKADLSGSEYLYLVHRQKKGNPQIDMDMEKAVQAAALSAIEAGVVNSAHDCSEGGLAVALVESCVTAADKMLGVRLKLDDSKNKDLRADEVLFGEAPSRIVVSLAKGKLKELEKIAAKYHVPFEILGDVGGEKFIVKHKGDTIIDLPLARLSDAWRKAIPSRIGK
jgi:phosphoribosylformylglycinamidine synthase